MAGSGFGDVMSAWRLGKPTGDGQAPGGQHANRQGGASNLMHRSELVPINQTLLSPALADAFAIPMASIPISNQSGYDGNQPPMRDNQASEEGGSSDRPPIKTQVGSTGSWMPLPSVPPCFFPGGLMGLAPAGGSGYGPGVHAPTCNPQMPQMPVVPPPGMAGPDGQTGLSGPALMQQGPQDMMQQGGGDLMHSQPQLLAEPTSQWKGLACPAAGQEQQQDQQQLQLQQQQQQLPLQQQQLLQQQQQQQQMLCSADDKPQRRTRVFWTSDLKKRFENAVEELGLDHATPKQILRLMLVDGLTRENVASHLQKFRVKHRKPDGQMRHRKSNNGPAESLAGSPDGERSMHDDLGDEEPEGSEPMQDVEQEGTSACGVPPAHSDGVNKGISLEGGDKDGCA